MGLSAATLKIVAHDAPVGSAPQERLPATRRKFWWVRWAVLAVAAIVLGVEATLVWDQLAKAWASLLSANWWWVLAAAALLSSARRFASAAAALASAALASDATAARLA